MTQESKLHRISLDELPDLLVRLKKEQVTELSIFGPRATWLLSPPNQWMKDYQGRIIYQLNQKLDHIPDSLLSFDCLKSLTLWWLGLSQENAQKIADNLPQLTALDLTKNNIGDIGAKALAKNLTSLIHLDLTENQIGEKGVFAISSNHLQFYFSVYREIKLEMIVPRLLVKIYISYLLLT